MKAVIVECSNGAAVALCDDGSFRKLKNKGYSIGQELLIKQKTAPNHMMQKLSICASLALVLLSCIGIGSYSYVKPYSYVSLDINPSIEYALNRYDKVISVSGINERGQQVVSSIESDVKNQNIATALGVTIRQLEKENYIIKKEYNHVIVSVCSTNDSKAQSIASSLDSLTKEESSVCMIDTMTVSREVKSNADSLGITPAKLALINAVAETSSDSNFDISEWTDLTVSELEHTIQQANSQSPDSESNPVTVTVIDSEYLSSVLDDNTAYDSDSNPASSAIGANAENGSATTDKQTGTTNNKTPGSGNGEMNSPSKLDDTDSSTSAATGSNPSAGKNENADSTDKPTVPTVKDEGTTDQNGSPDQDSVPVKDDSDKNGSGSTSNGNTSADTDKDQADEDIPKEDSSNKKDPYPSSDTDTMEDFTDSEEQDTGDQISSENQEENDFDSLTDQEIEDSASDSVVTEDAEESGETRIIEEVSE